MNEKIMRAKMKVTEVTSYEGGQQNLTLSAVGGDKVKNGYPEDGSDEDNSFARWTPSATLNIHIANPALAGKFKAGDKFYVDFFKAEEPALEGCCGDESCEGEHKG